METRYYIVKKGDSLWGIARHFGCTVEELAVRNSLHGKQKSLIQVGQKIYLPGGDDDVPADLLLHIRIIGLSSQPLRHVPVMLTFDGQEMETKTDGDGWVGVIEIQDHSKGLKIEYQSYANEWEEIFDMKTLPLGEKVLQVNVMTDLLKGVTVRRNGPELLADAKVPKEVKKNTPQPTLPTKPRNPLPEVPAAPVTLNTRTSGGMPTTVHAPVFAEENLYLKKGNEKFRKAIIESAKRYKLTPHALAAIIHAEAGKTKDGTWVENSASAGSKARGLGQFLPAAWFQYVAKSGTLGNTEALKLTGASKLEAADGKLYKVDGKNKTEVIEPHQKTILSWRDNGGYSIDAIGAYAEDNLQYLKNHEVDATGLPPDEKVKIAYIMHHEGPDEGAKYLRGKLQKLEDYRKGTAKAKLASQFKNKNDDGTTKAKALAERFDGDYVKAYYYFLASHTDTMVRAKNFMLKHEGFDERSAYDVIRSVAGMEIEKPKGITASTTNSSKQLAGGTPSNTAKEIGAGQDVGGVLGWSDPLDYCQIRVGGYCDSVSNPASARAKSLFHGRGGKHTGIDLCAVPGTPIKAVANSVIYYAGNGGSYGNVIVLKVDINDLPSQQKLYAQSKLPAWNNIVYFMYAHLSEIHVKQNGPHAVAVKAGQVIGKTGDTGNAKGMIKVGRDASPACGAHLHFEARLSNSLKKGQGQWIDPKLFLNQCD